MDKMTAEIKVLVADDSRTVRTVVARVLNEAGYSVVIAADGRQALDMATTEQPDLAILDIVMPDLDGYAVCDRLKSLGSPWKEMPIVFLTNIKSQALEMLGNEYGAYMNKPVDPALLLKTIDEQLIRIRKKFAGSASVPNVR